MGGQRSANAGGRQAIAAFIGREHEFADLEACLQDAAAGRGRSVLVTGEAGIGKTYLAEAFGMRASGLGARVLWGRSWADEGIPSLWPWVQILRACAVTRRDVHSTPFASRRRGVPPAPLPELTELFPVVPDAHLPDSAHMRFRLFDAVTTFLHATAAAQVLVIVLDDLHAADELSLRLLEFIAYALHGTQVLLIGTLQLPLVDVDGERARILEQIGRESHVLALGRWSPQEVALFVCHALARPPSKSDTSALHAATRGNPLAVSHAVSALRADGHAGSRLHCGTAVRSLVQPSGKPAPLFRREGEYWTVSFEAQTYRFRDSKGFAHLAQLLMHPGEYLPALTLARMSANAVNDTGASMRDERGDRSDAGAVLDRHARAAYQRRLCDLRVEHAEAQRCNDAGRGARAQREIEQLTRELAYAVGLGGRDRRLGSPAERARVNVTRAINLALRKIAPYHEGLSTYLRRTVKTGLLCVYLPENAPRRGSI
jgi:AAA ATPase-like protein